MMICFWFIVFGLWLLIADMFNTESMLKLSEPKTINYKQ